MAFAAVATAGVGRGDSGAGLLDSRAPDLTVSPIPIGTTYRGGQSAVFDWSFIDANPSLSDTANRAWLEVDGAPLDSLTIEAGKSGATWTWPVPERTSPYCYLLVQVVDAFGNRTLYRSPRFTILTSWTGVGDGDGPVRTALLSPCPNPFNPATEVAFALAGASDVRLEVFDLRGRRVRLLEAGPRGAGRHTLTWQGADDAGRRLPAGTYVLRLTARGAAGRSVHSAKVVMVP